MPEPTIISWNATNWITVVVMVAIGFTAISLAASIFRGMNRKGEA